MTSLLGRAFLSLKAVFVFLLTITACAPHLQVAGPAAQNPLPPRLMEEGFRTADGLTLGVQKWEAENPRAVLVGVHGMNDYANAFDMPGGWWAEHAGLTTYAYDQRGFGRSPQTGIWPGGDAMVADLDDFVATVRARHPGLPLYIVGVSMGGAVTLATLAERKPSVDGVILVAPALWGWSNLPLHYRITLWLGAHLFPGKTFTGSGLDIWPSDNIEMLRAFSADPLVIKGTRTDAIYGLVKLMQRAYEDAPKVNAPILLLYGEKDEVIPKKPVARTIARLCAPLRFMRYEKGYHMLLRDLQAETVWRDIAAWTENRMAELPSREEVEAKAPAETCPASAPS